MFLDPLIVIEEKIVYYRSFNFVQRPKDSFKRYSIINRGVRFSFLRSKLAEDSNSNRTKSRGDPRHIASRVESLTGKWWR